MYPPSAETRLHRALYNLDRAGASLIWGTSQETISSMAGRACQRGALWGRAMCRMLGWFETDHCKLAIEHADKLAQVDDGKEV